MRINHIGYAVQDIESASEKFIALGYVVSSEIIEDIARKVCIQFFEDANGVKVELIAPLCVTSPISAWIKKNGSSPYHICYECQFLEETIAEMNKIGFLLVRAPEIAPALGNKRVAFLYSSQMGLLELVEMGRDTSSLSKECDI